jgi:hypothetical protein
VRTCVCTAAVVQPFPSTNRSAYTWGRMNPCTCDACRNRLVTDEQAQNGLCDFCARQCFPLCEYGVRIQKTHAERARLHGDAVTADPIRATAERVMGQFLQAAERALVEEGIPLLQQAARGFLRDQLTKHLRGGR